MDFIKEAKEILLGESFGMSGMPEAQFNELKADLDKAFGDRPFFVAKKTALSSKDMMSMSIAYSSQPKSEWKNGIFENSYYIRLMIHEYGVIESLTRPSIYSAGFQGKKFRKSRFKDNKTLITKLKKFFDNMDKEFEENKRD